MRPASRGALFCAQYRKLDRPSFHRSKIQARLNGYPTKPMLSQRWRLPILTTGSLLSQDTPGSVRSGKLRITDAPFCSACRLFNSRNRIPSHERNLNEPSDHPARSRIGSRSSLPGIGSCRVQAAPSSRSARPSEWHSSPFLLAWWSISFIRPNPAPNIRCPRLCNRSPV